MIERDLTPRLRDAAESFPVVTVTGPRQSGKSTLCRAVFPVHPYVNLEEPDTRAFAADDPRGFLGQYPKGAIIDEVQRCPSLPSYLQSLVDADPHPGRWILTGSQNLTLLESITQSLAGRSAVLNLLPLARNEVIRFNDHPTDLNEALLTGGYPRVFDQNLDPSQWLGAYVATYLERDVRSLSNIGDLATFQRFVQLCAGRTAQMLNLSGLASNAGVSQPTAKAWLSILETTFIAYRLQPWHGNLRKRLVKTPKLHFYDTGLACWLLGIRTADQLKTHPLRGAIFETWMVSEIIKHRTNRGETTGMYYYRDAQQLEADCVIEEPGRVVLVEAKAGATVTQDMLKGVRKVSEVLDSVDNITKRVITGGQIRQERSDVAVVPWNELYELTW